MTDLINARPAELLLDWEFLNPADAAGRLASDMRALAAGQIIEAVGIIPDIFTEACVAMEGGPAVSLDDLAGAIDDVYGFGGFIDAFEGELTDRGVYVSPYDEDADLSPFVRLIYPALGRYELLVFPYGICALRDRESRECRIGRLA